MIKTRKLRATWCLLALAAIYSHFYVVLWILPQVWALWITHRRLGWQFFQRIVVIAALGVIPLVVFILRTRGGQLDWVPRLTPHYLLAVFVQISGFSSFALALLSAGSALGCVHLWKKGEVLSRLIVLENVLPIALLLLCSFIHPVFVPRFLIFAIPFLTITAMVGFSSLRLEWGSLAFASLVATMIAVGDRSAPKGDWGRMTAYLCSQKGQAVAFWPAMQRLPYWYYSRGDSTCPKPLGSESREVGPSDFGGDKRAFAAELCSSGEESIVMVMDSDWRREFPKAIPAIITSCYVPTLVSRRDGLQLIRLNRSARMRAAVAVR